MVKKENKEVPKEEKKVEPEVLPEVPQEKAEKKGGRESRFKKLLEAYQIQNPVKYDIKKKNGEFSPIPDSFK